MDHLVERQRPRAIAQVDALDGTLVGDVPRGLGGNDVELDTDLLPRLSPHARHPVLPRLTVPPDSSVEQLAGGALPPVTLPRKEEEVAAVVVAHGKRRTALRTLGSKLVNRSEHH